MGESKLERANPEETFLACAGVQTVEDQVQFRWESKSTATPMGQLAYFIEFSSPIRFAKLQDGVGTKLFSSFWS